MIKFSSITDNTNKNIRNQNNLRKDWITIGLAKSSEIKQNLYDEWQFNRTEENWTK